MNLRSKPRSFRKERRAGIYACHRLPAEEAPITSVHRRHHLRRVLRPPLREEMGMLKIFDPMLAGNRKIPLQQREIEGIFPSGHRDPHQLNRHPLFPDGSVQRRREAGGQKHVHPVQACLLHIIGKQIPKTGGKGGHAVGIAKAIAMEPVGILEGLLGQGGVDNRNGQRRFAQLRAVGLAEKLHQHRMLASRNPPSLLVEGDPDGAPGIGLCKEMHGIVLHVDGMGGIPLHRNLRIDTFFQQTVGKQARPIAIVQLGVRGLKHGHIPHGIEGHGKIGGNSHEGGRRQDFSKLKPIGDLKGQGLVIQTGQTGQRRLGAGIGLGKHLFQRA